MVDASHLRPANYLTEDVIKINTSNQHHVSISTGLLCQAIESGGAADFSSPNLANALAVPNTRLIPPRPAARIRHKRRSLVANHPALPPIASGPTIDVFRSVLTSIDLDLCEENGENAFYVCDLAYVYRQFLRWQSILGSRVDAFFAVKCNPDLYVLKMFAKLGMGFDCASHAEIELVLSLGVCPSRIIYANPCKAASFVRHAHSNGVQMMTFDNADELQKVAKHHPDARMVLRILTDDSGSLCRLGEKFGAPLGNVRYLLDKARELGVDVIGVAFHVGSGCSNPELYLDAVARAKWTFDLATELGFKMNLLDVGGGFGDENFDFLARGLLTGLDRYFPVGCGVQVIAEPGRYFVTRAFELATNIIARRQIAPGQEQSCQDAGVNLENDTITMYYVNDGVYGAFNCIIFDHKVVQPQVLTLGGVFYGDGFTEAGYPCGLMTPALSDHEMDSSIESLDSLSLVSKLSEKKRDFRFLSDSLEPSKIFGPSCDSIDLICSEVKLPTKHLKVGDWIRWPNMGAYTICAASQFNGFKLSQVKYTIGSRELEEQIRSLLE